MSIQEKINNLSEEKKKTLEKESIFCAEDSSWCAIHKKHGIDPFAPDYNLVKILVYQEMYEGKNFIDKKTIYVLE